MTREDLKHYAVGHGIEIGAYHNPFPLNPGVKVDYLDIRSYEELCKMRDKDPYLTPQTPIARVDIVDSGQLLSTVPDNKYDFLVSSHQLEHVECPLTAIKNHIRVVKPGANLIYFIPDKRQTFDRDRAITSLEHLKLHYESKQKELTEKLLMDDYHDYFLHVDKLKNFEERDRKAREHLAEGRDVHFHVWDLSATLEMFVYCEKLGFPFTGVLSKNVGHENLIIIKKTGVL